MTANRSLKRQVRARAAKTGESYTTALRHFRPTLRGDEMPKTLRLAVAQTTYRDDPRDPALLRASGQEIRRLMRDAHAAGARIVHFTEGATCFPNKHLMSSTGPDEVGPADWTRFRWDVLRDELTAITRLAGELGLWTVLGSVHPLTAPNRPHNSLYVISDRGKVATRYDERTLSTTKRTWMYTAGTAPVTFEVDGFTFGCALGMDVHMHELFSAYEDQEVDCLLVSTTGGVPVGPAEAAEAQGYAATHHFWVSFAVTAEHSLAVPSGVTGLDGSWTAQCPADGRPAVTLVELNPEDRSPGLRTWRRNTRRALADHLTAPADTRSTTRTSF
ncbi:Nitrilase/cyanide hydratase and apolipoprotein N- acyltransferase [Kribbella flavida DSM 17836]|uniref:Nitrilase/cyanide hydratase and apolipoprotein N-acyltransferase n=1 Tax=Kribbella flavida (strain DSM 17836 / JCM 10339 / NBRC 14399) TaxID=479435 RepID=D2PT97_KRIFD|nr:carbon-nitrogen hydrolase family protein [Kribbella flavida]ADB29413.1 Nitrilase/cyanide hydratase and apolipoprotein N- acyltransferase [Kribbella flavida DSM 17836]